jgi:DNA-binding XRE family transcriptional regulator
VDAERLLDEARELYHEAARAKGDASDAALIAADRKLFEARDAFRGAAKFAPIRVTFDQFGRRIRQLRERAGLTQEQLAAKIGDRSGTTIAHWENGRRAPSLPNQYRLAEALSVEPGEFFRAAP